jgi:enterochelin esterase-like enzyme
VVGKTTSALIAVFLEFPPMSSQAEGQIFVGQVLPAVDKRYRTLADREHRANIGLGWPGLGAALTTFLNSDQFGILGVQSFFSLEETIDMLVGAIGNNDAASLPMKIYLEWGRWDLISPHEEMDMRASSKQVWDLLTEKGWEPIGGEVWDSTDWASWRNRTGTMLEALFPLDGAESSLAVWQTSAP